MKYIIALILLLNVSGCINTEATSNRKCTSLMTVFCTTEKTRDITIEEQDNEDE